MGMARFACFLLFILLLRFGYAAITTESPLSIGKTLSSANNVYELGFFSPNNSQNQYVGIWFKGIIPRVVVWVANRENPVTDSTANLAISSNGSLFLFSGKHDVVWSTGETFGSSGSRAELSDSGNLFVIDKVSGRPLWQSFDHLGDTLLPSSSMFNLATGEKRVLTSWKSYTDPSPGEFMDLITTQVPSQGFIMRGLKPYWRSGPWAKTRFTGVPQTDDSYTHPFSVQQDANGSVYFSHLQRNFNRSFLVLTSEGSLKIIQRNATDWELKLEVPANSCDFYGVCGPFGLCVMSIPPKCECFKGFVPQYSEEWKRGNWTGGCVRRTELHCQGNSTGKHVNVFHPVANIKPPDFYEFVYSGSAEECYQSCLHNCSCLAFSYINGIGCLVWNQELMDVMQFSAGGELLSIRIARSEMGGNKRKKTITASIASLSIFVILASAAFGFWRYRVKHNAIISTVASQGALRNDLTPQDVPGLQFFEMKTIEIATNNFSLLNKLGQGGFGSVYKGKLQDGEEINVKRVSSSSGQGKEEFMNELVLISKLQHRHLVPILGCCIEGEERLLIYEFAVNKSLVTFIFDPRKRLAFEEELRTKIDENVHMHNNINEAFSATMALTEQINSLKSELDSLQVQQNDTKAVLEREKQDNTILSYAENGKLEHSVDLRIMAVQVHSHFTPLQIRYGSLPRPPEVSHCKFCSHTQVKVSEKHELGDKLSLKGGSIVKPLRVHLRRKKIMEVRKQSKVETKRTKATLVRWRRRQRRSGHCSAIGLEGELTVRSSE